MNTITITPTESVTRDGDRITHRYEANGTHLRHLGTVRDGKLHSDYGSALSAGVLRAVADLVDGTPQNRTGGTETGLGSTSGPGRVHSSGETAASGYLTLPTVPTYRITKLDGTVIDDEIPEGEPVYMLEGQLLHRNPYRIGRDIVSGVQVFRAGSNGYAAPASTDRPAAATEFGATVREFLEREGTR